MRTWDNIKIIVEELKKYKRFRLGDLIRLIEAKLLVSESTARQYVRMMLRHEIIEWKGGDILALKEGEEIEKEGKEG